MVPRVDNACTNMLALRGGLFDRGGFADVGGQFGLRLAEVDVSRRIVCHVGGYRGGGVLCRGVVSWPRYEGKWYDAGKQTSMVPSSRRRDEKSGILWVSPLLSASDNTKSQNTGTIQLAARV